MKKLFTLLLLATSCFTAFSQTLLIDDFNYSGKLTDNGWRVTGTSVVEEISTTTGLTYTNYTGSNIGNAANIIGTGQDVHRDFDSVKTDGASIYCSFLLKVTDATAQTGAYFFHIGNKAVGNTTFGNFCARMYAKTDASGNVNFAVLNTNTAPTYGTTNYAINTTYLIVIKYTISVGGNDNVKMWIKSTGVPQSEVAAGTPDFDVTDAGQNSVNAIGLRQASGLPDVVLDGLRIGQSWSESVLPVTLKSISASLINNQPQINWETSNETNFDYFGVEKSFDAKNFTEIARVASTKASNGSTYQYADINKTLATQFYRLKMVDNDGTFKHSSVVAVNAKPSISLALYPNPVTNAIILSHPKAIAGAAVTITSIDGKILSTKNVQIGATQTSIDATKFVKGNYVVSFVNDGVASTTQLVKQ
ncbi:MAG: T9SS type A sorting domain-containing protein [Flavobacterium sp.]|nr:T9SS type A sorting domain-containing protein [Flavobacterium sp.]